jgi:tRNA-dihydrouridine synthase A
MMECTDRHERYFLRLLTKRTLLYTEMVPTGAIVHGDRERFLGFDPFEHPVALQVGGSDPGDLETCARAAEDFGYDEINLNVGCPSNRVQSGRFGACLMAEPEVVAAGVAAMRRVTSLPVTVKTRIGIDDQDTYEDLTAFVQTVADSGCGTFIIHARKAWLKGLSPKENREVPPLRYDVVSQLKKDFPALEVIVNGGIRSLQHARDFLAELDGVMIGREAYENPYMLVHADREIFGEADDGDLPGRRDVLDRYLPYIERRLRDGDRLTAITRHLMGLFQGLPGARQWRRYLSENAHKEGAGVEVVCTAVERMKELGSWVNRQALGGTGGGRDRGEVVE